MTNTNRNHTYYETLAQNAQKGEIYILELKDDPVRYTTIPMIHLGLDAQEKDRFTFKVLQPEEYAGVYTRPLSDIVKLEKK
jgi:hypothetical protein